MKKIILITGFVFLSVSFLFAQTQTIGTTSKGSFVGSSPATSAGTTSTATTSTSTATSQTSQKQKEVYDLEINDLYLDKNNKICVVLKLLDGTIPSSEFKTIKLSLKASSLGNIPDVELSRVDPNSELNSRKKIYFNIGIVLKSIDTVSANLINVTDKNLSNNSLKERLIPKISQAQQEKTAAVTPSTIPSAQTVAGITQSRIPSGRTDTGLATAQISPGQRIPGREGDLTTLSNQPQEEAPLPEVLNILYCPAYETASPKYREFTLEELRDDILRLDWNIFGIRDFKQITIKIVYIDEQGRERRIDEFSRALNDPPFYEKNYSDIFNHLVRNRWIGRIDPWKTYRFKITGSVTIEKPSTQANQGSGLNVGSGTQAASIQGASAPGRQTSGRQRLPTNSFDIYYFIKGQENTNIQPPTSQYQQVQAG
ncbi:MAG: hypothetical protein NC829_03385, partial [Candidatus Omnitrophica bacterium]|nr:hypothetical protein [Candidatus Omnitrophota bacterium]